MIRLSCIMLFILVCVPAQPVLSQFYEWIDKDGKKQFTTYPPPDQSRVIHRSPHSSSSESKSSLGTTGGKYFRYSSIPPEYSESGGVYLRMRKMLKRKQFNSGKKPEMGGYNWLLGCFYHKPS